MSNNSLKFFQKLRKSEATSKTNHKKERNIYLATISLRIVLFCIKTFTFMLICVQIQFRCSSREIEKHIKQHKSSI